MAGNIEEVGVEAVIKGFAKFQLQMAAMNNAIAKTGVIAAASATGVKALSIALIAIGAVVAAVAAGVAVLVGAFFGIAGVSLKVARSVESAFAGVAKTTNGLVDEFGKMTEAGDKVRDQFRLLAKEIPLALEDLLDIGALAGQLGIAEDALSGFTEVIAALAVSTNLSAEQATLALARIANIYDISTKDMVENTERLASAIVFLGNNFATTEGEIADFAERIAGTGRIAGLTQADIAGIGAAFTSVGVEAQAGGTAVQTVLIAITKAVAEGGEKLETFADVAGQSSEEFAKSWEEDAGQAFTDFVIGLGDAGTDAFQILEDLDISDKRLIRGFLSVAAAGDLMSDAIDQSTEAFEANTALAREAAIRYATVDSKVQIFKNSIRDVALSIGDLLLPKFADFLEAAGPVIEAIGEGLVPAFEDILGALEGPLFSALGRLADSFGFDVTNADLTQGLINFGETIAGGIETFAGFVEDVAELIDIFSEGGIDSLAEHFGIDGGTAQLFLDVGAAMLVASGAFLTLKGAIAGAGIVIGAIGALAFVLGELGAAFSLIAGGAGIAATLGALFVGALPAILLGAVAILIGIIVVFGERAVESFLLLKDQAIEIFRVLWEKAVENFNNLKDQVIEIVEVLKDRAAQAFDNLKDLVISKVVNFVNDLIEKVVTLRDGVVARFTELRDRVVETVISLWERAVENFNNLKDQVSEIIAGVVTFLVGRWEQILEDFGITEEIKERWAQIWEDVKLIADTLWERISESLTTAWQNLVDFVTTSVVEPIVSAFSGAWESIEEAVSSAWDAIIVALSEAAEKIGIAIDGFITDWVDRFNKSKQFWIDAGADILTWVLDGLNAALEPIRTFITDFFGEWETRFDESVEFWVGLGEDVIGGILGGLEAAFDTIGTFIGEFFTEWKTRFDESVEFWKTIGKNIIDGMLEGLKIGSTAIIEFITGLAEGIIQSIKDALKIPSSPSGVFMDIGQEMMQGLAVGIAQNAGLPQVALDAVVGSAISAGAQVTNASAALAGNTDKSFNPTINAVYNREQAPNTIASDLALIAMLQGAS